MILPTLRAIEVSSLARKKTQFLRPVGPQQHVLVCWFEIGMDDRPLDSRSQTDFVLRPELEH
jgi:hypothetical protein